MQVIEYIGKIWIEVTADECEDIPHLVANKRCYIEIIDYFLYIYQICVTSATFNEERSLIEVTLSDNCIYGSQLQRLHLNLNDVYCKVVYSEDGTVRDSVLYLSIKIDKSDIA